MDPQKFIEANLMKDWLVVRQGQKNFHLVAKSQIVQIEVRSSESEDSDITVTVWTKGGRQIEFHGNVI